MLRLACTAAASAGLPYDALMALRGVSAPNACTGYALLPMPDAAFEEDFVYDAETGNYPAAYIMLPEPRLVAVGLPHAYLSSAGYRLFDRMIMCCCDIVDDRYDCCHFCCSG